MSGLLLAPLALVLALGATSKPAPADTATKPVPEMVREVLADKKFQFCHDPRYPLTDDEIKLCPFIVASNPACPALAEACKKGTAATQLPPPRKLNLDLPDLAGLPRLFLLALLGLAVGGVLYLLLRNVRPWQKRDKEPEESEAEPATAQVVTPQEVETDVERLLARARASAAAGDYARAIIELHAALLRRLEGAGVVAVHPSRTNGDYVRAVANSKPDLAAPVRSFVTDVERVQYGTGHASPELFATLLARMQTVAIDKLMVLVLVVAMILGASACRDDRGGWEYSPSGRAGVMTLLRRAGRKVHERMTGLAKLKGQEVDALVLLPGAELSDGDWEVLQGWVGEEGGTLVLAGMPEKRPDWVGGQRADKPTAGIVSAAKSFAANNGSVFLSLPPSPALRLGSDYQPLLVRGAAGLPVYAAQRSYQEGSILALADDRLFTNGALPFGDNARALVLLLADTTRIELVGELTGFVSPNPVASVTRGRLAPFLAQLAALALVFFLFRGVAFGRLREPPPPRRRSFIEHVEAVGEQYARARAARHVLGSYGQWVVERLRERVALPAGSGLIALADAVAVRTGKPAGEVMRLLMEAREVPAPAAPGTAEDVASHLAAVRALGDLLTLRSRYENRT